NQHFWNLNRYAIETMKAANCGEYADVLGSHLVESTTGQWVHKAGLKGISIDGSEHFDHGFVITAPQQLPTATVPNYDGDRLPNNLPTRPGIVMDDIVVADSWDNDKLMSLDKFLDHGSCYPDQHIAYEDVQILTSQQAQGQTNYDALYPQDLRNTIRTSTTQAFARYKLEKKRSWDETTIYQSEKSSGLSFARKGGGGGVWAIATDNSLHGRHQEATRLWDLVGDLSRSEKTEAFTDWASDTNARIDWTRPAQASTVFQYLVDKGGNFRSKADSLIDPSRFPPALTGKQLWKYVERQGLHGTTKTVELTTLIHGLSTAQLQALRRYMWRKTFNRHVVPKLTQLQKTALGIT
ncbi:MAG: hypothetical protein KC457_29710, partial [Myxococcales bacterium]|nr:hypothetical protein [Myxococcales bacterium]